MAEITIIPAKERCKEIVRTAAYARVSSDSEEQLNSYTAQIRYYTEMLQNSTDAVFVDMYADEGISGTAVEKRDEFLRLMRDCRKGKIDRILTKSISRFARNTKDCLEAVRELKSLGVSVYFEKENIDTAEIDTELFLTLYSSFAQEESMSISKNVRMGFRKRMQDGSYVPSSVPFGYVRENGQFRIDEKKADIVRNIYKDFLNGDGAKTIAKRYDVNISLVKYALTNEKYIGDSVFYKWYTTDTLPYKCKENKGEREKYCVANTHTAIISKEDFEKAQKLIKQKGKSHKGKQNVKHIFSGVIYCGECGTLYRPKKRSDGFRWVCRQHDESAELCKMKQIPETEIKAAFIRLYNKLTVACKEIFAPTLRQLQELNDKGFAGNTQIIAIRKEIAETKEQCHMLATLKSQGILDAAYFTAHSQELDRKLVSLQTRLHAMLDNDENDEQIEGIKILISIFESAEQFIEFDEPMFRQTVEKITVLSDTELRFHLPGGVEFIEKIQRKERRRR